MGVAVAVGDAVMVGVAVGVSVEVGVEVLVGVGVFSHSCSVIPRSANKGVAISRIASTMSSVLMIAPSFLCLVVLRQ